MKLRSIIKILCCFSMFKCFNCYPYINGKEPKNYVTRLVKYYRPVVIIHGLMEYSYSLENMTNFIKEMHPGTEVYYLEELFGFLSVSVPLWRQVEIFYEAMKPIMERSLFGINLIGYSQGGLVARGILETKKHNVRNFVALSSPLAGQYGDAYLPHVGLTKETAYKTFYTSYFQGYSVPNYWNDPFHQDMYLECCEYLPYIDNMKPGMERPEYRNNFATLNKLVLIGGPHDGVISPWQSSQFGFYNDKGEMLEFRQRRVFQEDLFGLRTLDEANKIKIYTVPNIQHFKWHENKRVLKSCVLPWLD